MDYANILIVEDELIIAKVCEMFFNKKNIESIETVCCFKEAVEAMEENFPDLVLMDIQLRGVRSGIDLAHWIRERSDVPIIFSTGNGYKDTISKIENISNAKLLSKPVKFDQLEEAMMQFSKAS